MKALDRRRPARPERPRAGVERCARRVDVVDERDRSRARRPPAARNAAADVAPPGGRVEPPLRPPQAGRLEQVDGGQPPPPRHLAGEQLRRVAAALDRPPPVARHPAHGLALPHAQHRRDGRAGRASEGAPPAALQLADQLAAHALVGERCGGPLEPQPAAAALAALVDRQRRGTAAAGARRPGEVRAGRRCMLRQSGSSAERHRRAPRREQDVEHDPHRSHLAPASCHAWPRAWCRMGQERSTGPVTRIAAIDAAAELGGVEGDERADLDRVAREPVGPARHLDPGRLQPARVERRSAGRARCRARPGPMRS